jgi:hypothetical protein
MAPLFISRRIPTEVDERLRLAAAAAAEQVLDVHVASALEVVEEGAERAPVERLLRAYARLHYLEDSQEWRLRERVLAVLGQEPGADWTYRELTAPRSFLRRLARRVRGRIHHDLREWVELHTARVQLRLVDLHVRHALAFVRILHGHATTVEALHTYGRMLNLRSSTAEFVRLKALLTVDRTDEPARAQPLHPQPPHIPLRLADGGS